MGKGDSRHDDNDNALPDNFLHLTDTHSSFQEAAVVLKQDMVKALATIRRRDGACLASALRWWHKAGKDLAHLAGNGTMDRVTTDRPSHLGLSEAGGTVMVRVVGPSSTCGMDASHGGPSVGVMFVMQ